LSALPQAGPLLARSRWQPKRRKEQTFSICFLTPASGLVALAGALAFIGVAGMSKETDTGISPAEVRCRRP
jgi:hypothetical protein